MEEAASSAVAALYVGNLDGTVTEEQLHQLFSRAGNVLSVKICIDEDDQNRSLGYGYVNYLDPQDAEKGMRLLNSTRLNGKCIRIAYSDRDGSLRRSGCGNIFVKNLDPKIDHKALHNIFSPYGKIFSCKVESDPSGQSKGYGYVQFTNAENARIAIDHLHGKAVYGRDLHAVPYLSRQEREAVDKISFTNVYVKNISASTSEEDLKSIFGKFGSITSVVVMRDRDGRSRCFGFVNFEYSEDAARSVQVLNGRIFEEKRWYVSRAQKKLERKREMKLPYNNLYVKNLDDSVDDEKLEELFAEFGTIISCKVITHSNGRSKGYGFVAFSTVQETSRAILSMNGKMIGGNRRLHVSIAERKECRLERFKSDLNMTGTVPTPVAPLIPIRYAGPSTIAQSLFYDNIAHPLLHNTQPPRFRFTFSG